MSKITRLGKSDVTLMRELNLIFAEAFQDSLAHLSKKPSDSYLEKLLAKEHVIMLAAFEGEIIVGGLLAYVLEKYEQERAEIYIYDLAVAEEFRRRGIARQLILKCREIGKQVGAWMIFVQADRQDLPAVALYQSMGEQEEPLHFDIAINERENSK